MNHREEETYCPECERFCPSGQQGKRCWAAPTGDLVQHFMAGAQRQHLMRSLEHPGCLCCGAWGSRGTRCLLSCGNGDTDATIRWDADLGAVGGGGDTGWVAIRFV